MNKTTILEIDIKKFLHNIEEIQKYVGNKELMPVIKANGYGTYINKRIDVINRFNIVAVARTDEAVELRNLGYNKDIFILNQPAIEDLEDISKYNLIVGLSEITFLEKIDMPIRVHLEIETGMNRTGIKLTDLDGFISKIIGNTNISVEGVYTHLSSADNDSDYTKMQIDKFYQAVEKVRNKFNIKYIHCSASNGLLNYPDKICNLVRPGLIMYGYESFEGVKDLIDIEPIAVLKTKITYLKDLDSGESVSYGRKFISSSHMKVATIPIGYADGFRRSSNLYVSIHGVKCPVIGSVCMDSCMVDVTELNDVNVYDDVYIFDNNVVKLEDLANCYNTINYEVLCGISTRVQRKFI